MSKRKHKRKHETQAVYNTCLDCDNCQYIGEGDHICDLDMTLVIDEWTPTEDFCKCGGKEFVERMKIKVKFIFHFKSGKTLESICSLSLEKFKEICNTMKTAFTEDVSGCVTLEDCIVNLSECAAVEWEVFEDEQEE